MKKSKIVSALCLGVLLLGGGGCIPAGIDNGMAKLGYHHATREQILRPVQPTFPMPAVRTPIAILPRDKVVGKWSTSYVIDSRGGMLSRGYDGLTSSMTAHQTYLFFSDGTCKTVQQIDGKETTWNGNWDYQGNVLTIAGMGGDGKQHKMGLTVIWYGENEFETRLDVPSYEQMMKVANVQSVTCRYEANGILHTQIIMVGAANGHSEEFAQMMVQSPQIYTREGDVD